MPSQQRQQSMAPTSSGTVGNMILLIVILALLLYVVLDTSYKVNEMYKTYSKIEDKVNKIRKAIQDWEKNPHPIPIPIPIPPR